MLLQSSVYRNKSVFLDINSSRTILYPIFTLVIFLILNVTNIALNANTEIVRSFPNKGAEARKIELANQRQWKTL